MLLLVVPLGWIALRFLVPLWLIAVSVTLFRGERDGYSGTTSHRAQADA